MVFMGVGLKNKQIAVLNPFSEAKIGRVISNENQLAQQLNILTGYKLDIKSSDDAQIRAAIAGDTYTAASGQVIKEKEVIDKLNTHFEVQPGITADYVKNIFSKVSSEDMQKLDQMKAQNVELRDKIQSAIKRNDDNALASLGKDLAEATSAYLSFMSVHHIPFIVEVTSEIGIENYLHTYSGGLGVLMGDKHKVLTDMGVPTITFSVLPQTGYGGQMIDYYTREQIPYPDKWKADEHPLLFTLGEKLTVPTGDNFNGPMQVNQLVYGHIGKNGDINPVIYDSSYNIKQPDNQRNVTYQLYPKGPEKLASQYALATSAAETMSKIGMEASVININEGHPALTGIILARKFLEAHGINMDFDDPSRFDEIAKSPVFKEAIDYVRNKMPFVTHTIDPSAFDAYDEFTVKDVLGKKDLNMIYLTTNPNFSEHDQFRGWRDLGRGNWGLSMPELAISLSGSANAVAEIHKQVTDAVVFPQEDNRAKMHNVTNGIHSDTWWGSAKNLLADFKDYIGDYSKDYLAGFKIMQMKNVPVFREGVSKYHLAEKAETVDYINDLVSNQHGVKGLINADNLDNTMTAVFARRAKGYKQNDLLVEDRAIEGYIEQAKHLKDGQQIVIVVAGKAHAKDMEAQGYVKHILDKQKEIYDQTNGKVVLVYKENYDMNDGKMFAKFDMNLANPVVGWEASGTSPMKNPLRLIMHTFDGFFAEFSTLAKNVFGIDDVSFGFGPKTVEKNYTRPGVREEYARAYKEKFGQAVDTFFNHREQWTDKQIEQLAIFTMSFQMERFADNYLTIWNKYLPSFGQFLENTPK